MVTKKKEVQEIVRPEIFHHGAYCWEIKYLDLENEDHGQTMYDKKEIHIFVHNKDEVTIKDTLMHELLHVASEDVFKIIHNPDEEETSKMEENFILLVTPRLMNIFLSNKQLVSYLWG